MFPFGSPYGSSFQSYDPYEQYLVQQELQRRRQAEEYYRRQQLEELNRRRAEQLAYARRQAELQRLREAEALRLREQEMEARRRKLSAPSQPRNLRFRDSIPAERGAAQRSSMFDGGVQDLFDAIYGDRARRQPSPSSSARRSASSDPRSARLRFEPEQPEEEVIKIKLGDNDAVSDTEEPPVTTSQPQPPSIDPAPPAADSTDDIQPDEVDTSPSQTAISNILSKFASLKSDFKFPTTLNFLNSPEGDLVTTPKLAYTPNNAPLHQYEHLLTGLLTQLDAVESFGQESIRKARKDAVRAIEQELGELDARKLQEWRRQFAPTESEMPVVDSEMSAVESQTPAAGDDAPVVENEGPIVEKRTPTVDSVPRFDSQPKLPQDAGINLATSTTADAPITDGVLPNPDVDPVFVPLPIDEDKVMHAETTSARSSDAPSEPVVHSESTVPSEPAALSEPTLVPLPQSSNVLPPVDGTERLDHSTTLVSAKSESAPSVAAPTPTPNEPEPEAADDGHVNAASSVKPEDVSSKTDDTKEGSS